MIRRDMRTWAEINLGNLEHNYHQIKARVPSGCGIMGLCKANAYGHGDVEIAKRLEALGASYLSVACFSEAERLKEAGLKSPVLILSPSPAALAPALAALDIHQMVGGLETARAMSAALAGQSEALHIHIKLDTGMGRAGFNVMLEKTADELAELARLPGLAIDGLCTHFAVSDEPDGTAYTKKQYALFMDTADRLERRLGRRLGIRHCANSGAVVNYPEMALDMIRPGILMYGAYQGETPGLDMRPVMSLKTRIAAVSEHRAGDTISYGRAFTCERDMRVAVIPVGYADGLHRSLSGKLEVSIRGQRVRQIGRICMDMCMLDITDLPEAGLGELVTIFGENPTAAEHAKKIQTISYELLCAVSERVPRIYRE